MIRHLVFVVTLLACGIIIFGMPEPVSAQTSTTTATVSGKVYDDAGTAITNASVSVYKSDYSTQYNTVTDSNGSYSILVSPDSYKIRAFPPSGTVTLISANPLDIILWTDEIRTQDLILLKAAKTIKGRVLRLDGTSVTNARVQAFRNDTYIETQTDSSGNYTLFVTDGSWSVTVFPITITDWVYNQSPTSITFSSNTTPEEKTVNFTVITVEASLKGKILRPDGGVPPKDSVNISFQGSQGFGYGAPLDENGSFFVQLPAGTYTIFIFVQDSGFSAPITGPLTIAKGESKDLGTLFLVKATKTIKGKVTRSDGGVVTDAVVNASRKDTQSHAEIQADSAGNYTLLVTGGTWEVHTYSRSQTPDWSYTQPSQSVVFSETATPEEKIFNFTVANIDATVKGRILLPDGTAPVLNTVSINLHSINGDSFYGSSDSEGFFSIGVASGIYNIFIWSQDPIWVPPDVPSITLVKGETKDLGTITLARATKVIKGKIRLPDGNPVTDAGVNAFRQGTGRSLFTPTDSAGNYILHTSGGLWEVSINPQTTPAEWNYNQPPQTVIFADDLMVEEKIVDFTVTVTDARVRGNIYLPDGTPPLKDSAWVNLRPKDADYSRGPVYSFGATFFPSGFFEVSVTAGTYELFVEIRDSNLIVPQLSSITLAKGEIKDLGNITLIKPPKLVKGTVRYPDGRAVTDASVNAFQSQTNAPSPSREVKTDVQGNFNLSLTGGIWEVSVYSATQTPAWVYMNPPAYVSFTNDAALEEKTVNFTVTLADAKVKGKIIRPDGTAPPLKTVFVSFQGESGSGFGDATDATGSFTNSLPAGTYRIYLYSEDPSLIGPEFPSFTLAKGATKDLGTIILVKPSKALKGRVLRQDGRAITDARVGAYRQETQRFLEAKTDSSGNYTLLLVGGVWEVSLDPSLPTVDWMYGKQPETIVFSKDTTLEEKTFNFTVLSSDAILKGKILKPDGTIPPPNTVFVGVRSSAGFEMGSPVDASGAFRIPLVAGTYNIFMGTQDPSLGGPTLLPITIASGETKDLGDLRLILRTEHIKGKVTDKDGKGIEGIEVNAFQPEGGGFAYTRTNSQGEFDLLVTPGAWEVGADPDPSTNLYSLDPPGRLMVVSGIISVINFVLHLADARITGQIVDEKGDAISDVFGFVDLSQEVLRPERFDFFFDGPGLGGPVERGAFLLPVPAGTYTLSLYLPPDSSYTGGPPQTVTIASGGTVSLQVKVFRNTSKITGNLKDEKGAVITGVKARVSASTKNDIWREAFVDPLTGSYSFNVTSGTWYLGYEIDSTFGYSVAEQNLEVNVGINATVTKDLPVLRAGSTLTGQVTDHTGKGVFYAFVDVSKTSFSGAFEKEIFKSFVAGAETDANGFYKIAVPAGTYFVKTFIPPEFGLISASEEKVSVADSQILTLNLKLRKADFTINGKVLTNGTTTVADSFVWGWSEEGGYQETISKLDGSYILNVTGSSTWRVASSKEINGVLYKASETSLFVGTTSIAHDIVLEKAEAFPQATLKTADASKPVVVSTSGGVTVIAPANSVSGGGSVSISVTPDERAPSQGDVTVIGIAYDIEAKDATGQEVSSFKAPVTLSLPYLDKEVEKKGVKEEGLEIGFWDETKGTWRQIENCVVNKAENNVTCKTTHFTRFAIVAAADITPPAAPTNVVASSLGRGKIKLVWENPLRDFSHAKIYRSATPTQLGKIRASEALGKEFIDDEELLDGILYYYVVRAVDSAGNESINTNQVSVKAVGASVKKKATAAPSLGEALKEKVPSGPVSAEASAGKQGVKLEILKNLTVGSVGDEVKILQELLLKESVYPQGLVTGFFGELTKQAVIRFQEKYAADILIPVGLTKGTGFVGPSTLKKLNELVGVSPEEKVVISSGVAVKAEIFRNLTVGSTGDDVKTFQELLHKEGVYPEGLITGFFGELTKQAVIRFQEKYASEILAPLGLGKGTGFVGSATRKKLNELFLK